MGDAMMIMYSIHPDPHLDRWKKIYFGIHCSILDFCGVANQFS